MLQSRPLSPVPLAPPPRAALDNLLSTFSIPPAATRQSQSPQLQRPIKTHLSPTSEMPAHQQQDPRGRTERVHRETLVETLPLPTLLNLTSTSLHHPIDPQPRRISSIRIRLSSRLIPTSTSSSNSLSSSNSSSSSESGRARRQQDPLLPPSSLPLNNLYYNPTSP